MVRQVPSLNGVVMGGLTVLFLLALMAIPRSNVDTKPYSTGIPEDQMIVVLSGNPVGLASFFSFMPIGVWAQTYDLCADALDWADSHPNTRYIAIIFDGEHTAKDLKTIVQVHACIINITDVMMHRHVVPVFFVWRRTALREDVEEIGAQLVSSGNPEGMTGLARIVLTALNLPFVP